VGDPRQPRRAEGDRPARVDPGDDGEADAGRPREARAAILTAEGVKQSQILTAEGEKQAAILKAEGERQATMLEAEGQAKAIETVFQAIHDGKPDAALLAYQYLQVLPQIAQGQSNKMWIIPSELTEAISRIGGLVKGDGAVTKGT
jgi:regulator of protease activity HflC (stomatin/prohibitin superfamily)